VKSITRSFMFLVAMGGLGVLSAGCGSSDGSVPVATSSAGAGSTSSVSSGTEGGPSGKTGAPSGAHYTLNIIGVPKGKTASMTSNMGHRIFVPLAGRTKILLTEGDFQVLDANATDGSGSFQLPNPDPDNDGTTEYSVYARALGKPGGTATLTTAATDPVTGAVYYSVESAVFTRATGGSKFTNVSSALLFVYADLDGDGVAERYPLFDDKLQDYFWEYDNTGLKLVQLRFYTVSTTVP
jgi:hypothetical protein